MCLLRLLNQRIEIRCYKINRADGSTYIMRIYLIFQSFFNSKPAGQGTGLGLSLSYDIVKAHGGEIKVETSEARSDDSVGRGEGTTFIISIPV